MHKYRNIAVTGSKQTGKSTLAREILQAWGRCVGGYQTVKYDVTPLGPLYALQDLESGKQVPISELLEGQIRGIPMAFQGFGRDAVLSAIEGETQVILLDEIGRFERNSPDFLEAVDRALDCEKPVIAVLKQEPLPYIQKIKGRTDTLVIDLDALSREEAWRKAQIPFDIPPDSL